MLKLAVTGTDTGVGKTVIASALLTVLRARGVRVGVMKPVETGVTRGEAGSDHVQLAVAAGENPDNSEICPIVHERPLAPWVASRTSGGIRIEVLDTAFQRICADRECVIVEGAGGLLVPITRTVRYDTLFNRWGMELLIVAADRLGAINHTLLTVEAAERAGLRIRGIILNQLVPTRTTGPGEENALALRELVPEIPVVEFPCVEGLRGTRHLHEYGAPLDLQLLRTLAEAPLDKLGLGMWGLRAV